jgi:hypothetical protein
VIAARSHTARRGRQGTTRRRPAADGAPLRPAPVIVGALSTVAVIGGWSAVVLAPPTPRFDAFTAIAAAALLCNYLFQLAWTLYVLPRASLFTRLTLTGWPYTRWAWTVWVLPAVLPLVILAIVTPSSLPTDSFLAGGNVLGVLVLHVLLFAIFALAAVLAWALVILPVGLVAASFLTDRPATGSVFGALSTAELRRGAVLPLATVGFAVSMANVSGEGRGRSSSMAHDLEEFVTLTGDPWAITATVLFLVVLVLAVVGLLRPARGASLGRGSRLG